jgi:hypothetical protein
MDHTGMGHMSDGLNRMLSNTILVMSTNPTKRELLVLVVGITMMSKLSRVEHLIVRMEGLIVNPTLAASRSNSSLP